jgi:HlyD family secretion protein
VIVAQVGENIQAGQPVLVIEAAGKQWLSFDVREDLLQGLTVGAMVDVTRSDSWAPTPAQVTELVPLGSFATLGRAGSRGSRSQHATAASRSDR